MTSKKRFDVERTALFGDMTQEEITKAVKLKTGRPPKDDIVREVGAQKGLTKDLMRMTFIVPVEQVEILKNHAYTDRLRLKNIVETAFREYIEKHVDINNLLERPEDWR